MKPRVLFITPLPPPVHGSAMVSQYIKDSQLVNEAFECDFVNLSTSRRMDEIGKGGVKKLLRFIGSYFALLGKLLTRRYDLCYLAITCHDMGFLKDAPFVLLCKLFRRKVLIHQHNKGMSGCVERWPYRWLLPLVYRNTMVMLLSWHLYDDIAKVVRREQVVICPNGIPQQSCDEDENENCLAGNINLTQNTQNSQNTHCFARVMPSGVGTQSHTDFTDYTDSRKSLRPCCLRDASLGENMTQEYSHADFNENDNENENCLRDVALNLTQTSQNSQNNESEQDNQRELDTIAQNMQVASPLLASGAHTHPDGVSAMSAAPSPSGEGWGEAPLLLFLSNLIPSKGVYVLLDACRILHERGLDFVCDFVGGETKEIDRAAFEAAVKERSLEGIVCYQGPKYGEEKEVHWQRADIFVFPTFYYNECFPLVLLEAMQHRLPVVSSDEGGIPDIIQHGVNGYAVARKEAAPLAEALEQLITDAALRREMGERGYARYRELYTLEAFEKRFVELLLAIG